MSSKKMSQSAKIRKYHQGGKTNSQIAKLLGCRYQTVWRTLHRKFQGVIPVEQEITKKNVVEEIA